MLAALFFVPLQRVEIASLKPIQAVWMYRENGNVILETDTDDKGSGATVADALVDMKNVSPGIVYLDTAQYLFISETAIEDVRAVQPHLKNSVRLCIWSGQGELKSAVEYADSHEIGIKIREWEGVGKLPELPPVKKEK